MSVNVLDLETYGSIANTLIEGHYSRTIFSYAERVIITRDAEQLKIPEYDLRESNIVWFVNRLYIANQFAYYMTYEKGNPMDIVELEKKDVLKKIPMNHKALLIKLKEVHYNLSDNNGHVWIDKKDLERLEALISYLALKVALQE